jgi:2-polyprenyl-6-hydroxyphenyl methylase/3-demethylubiquinone-9 3-methyltransferase
VKSSSAKTADPAEIAKFDALAPRFWDEQGEFRPLHRLNPVRAGYVASRAGLRGCRVLDVGCGGGLLAEDLAKAGGTVTAIDLSETMIEVARLHAAEGGHMIDYRVQAAEALATDPSARFDVVCCMEMLEHVPDPGAMLGTLGRLLAPGGQLFVSTINRNLKSFLLAIVGAEYVMRLLPRGTHEYERLIRPAELAGWARDQGLDVMDLRGLDYDPLTDRCSLTADVSVNYIAHLRPVDQSA